MDQRIIAAIEYISSHLDEKLDLKAIAKVAYLSPFHFHRLFKQETSLTLKKFIESLKIERAFQMMLQPESKIQEIAAYLGYNDSETFSRAFKRRYKIAPDDLKKVVQKAMEQLNVDLDQEQQCIVIAFKEESPEQITQKIMKTIREQQLNTDVLNEVKAFSLRPQTEDEANKPQGINKKFLLQERPEKAAELKDKFNSS